MNRSETKQRLIELGIGADRLPDDDRWNLYRADLSRDYLSEADLYRANLSGANLSEAYLYRADLRGAYLSGDDLSLAYLSWADLRGADLYRADLSGANLSRAALPYAPAIANIDAAILDAIESDGNALNMSTWHTCETTHCRAGWAITLVGEAGKVLESIYGPNVAGALIYNASRPGVPIPDWMATDEDAMADMRHWAGQTAAADEVTP